MVKGLFDSLRGEMASTRLAEDKLYEIVLAELKAGDIDEVAKARATVEAEGEEKKADALYIKHRIRRINDEHSANQMAANDLKLSVKSDAGLAYESSRTNQNTTIAVLAGIVLSLAALIFASLFS